VVLMTNSEAVISFQVNLDCC